MKIMKTMAEMEPGDTFKYWPPWSSRYIDCQLSTVLSNEQIVNSNVRTMILLRPGGTIENAACWRYLQDEKHEVF